MKLKPKKCELFREETSYLGHVVSEDGSKTDPKKIERASCWPTPGSSAEVKSFLGLASCYRGFVPGFVSTAKALYKLTEHDLLKFEWTVACQVAFER